MTDQQHLSAELELLLVERGSEADQYLLGWLSGSAATQPDRPIGEVMAEAIVNARQFFGRLDGDQ